MVSKCCLFCFFNSDPSGTGTRRGALRRLIGGAGGDSGVCRRRRRHAQDPAPEARRTFAHVPRRQLRLAVKQKRSGALFNNLFVSICCLSVCLLLPSSDTSDFAARNNVVHHLNVMSLTFIVCFTVEPIDKVESFNFNCAID